MRVGEQVWTAENLDVGRYNDGTAIKEAQSDAEWVAACAAGEGAWCYYPDNPQNAQKAGKLYNQYALARVCPRGWRIPTEEDWTKLCVHLGGRCEEAYWRAVQGRRSRWLAADSTRKACVVEPTRRERMGLLGHDREP